jgi:PPM family protein phosphatase
VALRIAEQAGATDVGRQRESNEDALVVAPPVFAVADGMGGARAGEVASHLAADAVAKRPHAEEPPEAQLVRIVREANRQIHELAKRDESRRGMGTTLTAAIVRDREVSIAHVGDSRAYLLRGGKLGQLTRDHSLVAELERSGQLSPEAAEHHPQKSIITRALGPEPDVDVDTYRVSGRAGDVFLLCSDGLTSMVSDDDVASVLRQAPTLQDAADALVRAANQSGGRDNITVVLFRLEAAEDGAEEPATLSGARTLEGLSTEEVRAASRDSGRPRARGAAAPTRDGRRRRRRTGPSVRFALALLVIAAVVVGLYAASRQVYFVGTNEAALVTVYRGLPYELPLGIHLYSAQYESAVPARAIPASRRSHVLDNQWRSRSEAMAVVRALERGQLEPLRTR